MQLIGEEDINAGAKISVNQSRKLIYIEKIIMETLGLLFFRHTT
jgi:hypothetical protein